MRPLQEFSTRCLGELVDINSPNGRGSEENLVVWTSQREFLIPRTYVWYVIKYPLLHPNLYESR